MDRLLIQKTHYEIMKDLLTTRGLLPGYTFETFISSSEKACGKDPSYEVFFQNSPIMKEFMELLETDPGAKPHITVYANVLYHIFCLWQQHERIFYVSPQLAINLARTDLNVDSYFVQSPFPEIYIQVEPGLYYIADSDDPEKEHPVRGFYVNLRENKDVKEIRIMVAAIRSNYSEISATNDDSIYYFKIFLKPGKVKEQVDNYLMELQGKTQQLELEEYKGLYNLSRLQELFFFVLNTLLFITSKDPDVIKQLPEIKSTSQLKNKAKIRKLLKRQSKETSLPVLILGPNATSIYSSDQIKSAGGIGRWKLDKRIYVSGHWRVQWYGSEKDSSRRAELIRIKPYEKGPEFSEVLERRYKVGKD